MLRAAALLLVTSSLAAAPVLAQNRGAGLFSPTDLARLGLERAWFTRVTVDSSRGRVAHVRQHVSSTRAFTVFEVSYDGGVDRFSERDLDRFGNPLGKEGAEKLARRRHDELQRRQRAPQLTTHTIPDISLYVTTNRGLVQAIDAETGRTRWISEVGNPRYPSEAAGVNDRYVAVVNGSRLYLFDSNDGRIVWQRQTRGAPGAGPAVTDQLVFVPMIGGAVETYQLDDHQKLPWVFRSREPIFVQPISTGSIVAWPTDGGHLYAAEANRTNVLYRIETSKPMVAAPTPLPPDRLLAGSTDGYLYCFEATSGSLQWRFSTGEAIASPPLVVGDAVFVATQGSQVFRLTPHGKIVWSSWGTSRLLAASVGRLYGMDDADRLIVLDAGTGTRLGSLPAHHVDLPILNRETDRILVAVGSGVLQCLRETNRPWPLIHVSLREAEAEEPQLEQAPEPEVQQPPARNEVDPFSTDAAPPSEDTTPFGTGSPFDAGPLPNPFGPPG